MESLARGFFYPSYFYNVTLKSLGLREWYNQINDNIILGALPSNKTASEIKEKYNVTHLLTLNEDHELGAFYVNQNTLEKLNINVERVTICDFVGVPPISDINKGADFIKRVVEDEKGVVYVHCKAGRSRSSMILGAYFIKHKKMSCKEAYDFLKSKRSVVAWHDMHWRVLSEFEKQEVFGNAGQD